MAEQFIWGSLQRALNDPTTIDEAIAAGIAAHNNAAESHLGDEQSLESHRENPIVDHPAESVVNDKIQAGARRWVAIVDPNSESDFDTIQGAVDYAARINPGDILIKSGTHYVDDNLILPPTLSLYGQGLSETKVVFDIGALEAITYTRSSTLLLATYSNAVAVTGTNIVNFSSITNPDGNNLIGAMFRVVDNGSIVLRRVVAILSPTSVSVAGAALTAGAAQTNSFRPGFEFVNGSNEVTSYCDLSDFYDQLFVGFLGSIFTTTTSFANMGALLKINDDGVLIFDQPFSGSSQDALLNLNAPDHAVVDIHGITFDGGGATAILYDDSEAAYYNISYCEFLNSDAPLFLAPIPDGLITRIEGCIFHLDSSIAIVTSHSSVFSNCYFTRTTSNSVSCVEGYHSIYDACDFFSGMGVTLTVFPSYANGSVLRNCNINGQRSFVLPGGTAGSELTGIRVESCNIIMNSGQTLGLNNRGNYFINNRIFGTTGTFTLASGSQYNVVSNNISDGSFTNSGSNNIMDNNLTY